MIKFLVKNSIRNIGKQYRFSLLSIFGLVIGISSFVIIMSWVKYELSFDNFNKEGNSIYRVVTTTGAETPNAMSVTLAKEIPEVVASARYQIPGLLTFKVGDKLFYENKIALADPSLFNLFNYPFLIGNADEALSHPFNIVLSEKMVRKYFGDEDALGKTILINNQLPATVSGVIKDLPTNSHLQFDGVIPYVVMKELGFDLNNWFNWNPSCYVKLSKNAQAIDVASKVQSIAEKYRKNNTESFVLQALKDIHFNTKLDFDTAQTTNPLYIYVLSFGALLILIIAIINYANLSVALQKNKMKEAGIKQTFGASRIHLIKQIFIQTAILVCFSFILSLLIINLCKPICSNLLGSNVSFHLFSFESFFFLLIMIVLVAIISGAYPAWLIFKLKSASILGKGNKVLESGYVLQKIPLVLQFMFSILLIIGAFSIHRQLNYIESADLGFNSHNIITLPLKNDSEVKYNSFKNELQKENGIESIAIKDNSILGLHGTNGSLQWEGKLPGEKLWVNNIYVDHHYFETLDIQFMEGRNFSENSTNDKNNAIIVNEELLKRIQLENPIGKPLRFQGETKEIIGVIKDLHFQSMHKAMEPQIYMVVDFERDVSEAAFVIIKYENSKMARSAITSIETAWNSIYPEFPFSFSFLNQEIENQYKSEKKLKVLMFIFSFMSILLSCLGLFAITVLIVGSRTKEIGIRKVNGARISEILAMLNKDFIKWVVIAFLIACPIAYYAMNKWLENFAYKTNLSWWIFALAGLLALGIALLTVSWQSWRAATRNPVEALRYE
jgi:putative ABC transport system permease protein